MAHKNNEENLIPFTERTEEEQRKIAIQGGIASVKARRERKSMQELAKAILGLSIKSGEIHDIEELQSLADIQGKNLTVDQAILLKQVEKALKGDLQSASFIRDTSGNKPIERTEVAEVPKIVDDVN